MVFTAVQGNALGDDARLSGASDVETPSAHSYATSRVDCAAFMHLSDPLKDVALPLDQVARELTQIPLEEEEQIGQEALAALVTQLGGRLQQDGSMVQYMTSVAENLLPHVQRRDVTYRFSVLVGSGMENALALPGGEVVVTQELLDRWIHNEAQLATVLGHEIAHVDARHPIAIIQYTRAAGFSDDMVVAQMLAHLAGRSYSSTLEEEADRQGAAMMHAAGYSVFQAVTLWSERESTTAAVPSVSFGGLLGAVADVALTEVNNALSTHPDAAKRACTLQQVAHDLYQSDPRGVAYVGRTNWTQRIPMQQRVY